MSDTWHPQTRYGALPRAVAAYGLAGSVLELPQRPLAATDFDLLLGAVQSQRVTGLLWQAVSNGDLPTTEDQADRVEWAHVQSLAGVLSLERLLLDTVAALEAAGIKAVVLKGSALSHLDYPDPSWRTFGDIDLLVQGSDFDHAVAVILERGHRRMHPEPRPGFDARFSKGTSFQTSDRLEIDLHRTFAMGPFGVRLDLEGLWRASDQFYVAGHCLSALPPEERFVHACYHAVLGETSPRLVPLRDAAQLALNRDLDLQRIHELVRASGGEAVVSRAVRHAWHTLGIADVLSISAWAQAYRVDPQEAAALAVYEAGSTYARKSAAAIRALPNWRERVTYVHALTFPRLAYLETRHAGRGARLRAGFNQARHHREESS